MTLRSLIAFPLAAVLATACGSSSASSEETAPPAADSPAAESPSAEAPAAETPEAPEAPTAELAAHTHHVACGCILEAYGRCGNYIEVDGEYVPIAGDLGLGAMEFCKKGILNAKVEGEMVDGEFVATSLEIVE